MSKINYVFRICNDSVFKEIFSRVPNALAALISECLNINYLVFENNIQIERSELNKHGTTNKSTTCDFIVKIEDNFKINIEINSSNSKGLEERNFLFISRLYSNMIPKGTKYKDLINYKVAQININRFRNVNNKILSRIMLTDLDTNIPTIQSIILYNFDIEKSYDLYYNYNKEKSNTNNDENEKLIRWGALLNTEKVEDIADIIGDDLMSKEDKEKFVKVAEELKEKYANFTQEQLEQHEEFKLAGEREAGFEQGIKQGIEHEKIRTVKNMIEEDVDISLISKVTNLTEEEIMKIKESN